jgi:hypothetical protein
MLSLIALSQLQPELTWLTDPAFRTTVRVIVWVVRNPPFSKKPLFDQVLIPVYTDTMEGCLKTSSYPPHRSMRDNWQLCFSFPMHSVLILLLVLFLVISNSTLSHSIHFDPPRLRVAHQSFPPIVSLSFPYVVTIASFRDCILSRVTATLSYIGSVLVVGYSSVFESQVISSPLLDQY